MSWSDDFDYGGGSDDTDGMSFGQLNEVTQNLGGSFLETGAKNFSTISIGEEGTQWEESAEHAEEDEGFYRQWSDLPASITRFKQVQYEVFNKWMDEVKKTLVWTSQNKFDRRRTGRGFTDRDVDLRPSIFAEVDHSDPAKLVLILGAKMRYAEYIETVTAGKFAYLLPAIHIVQPAAKTELLKWVKLYNASLKSKKKGKLK